MKPELKKLLVLNLRICCSCTCSPNAGRRTVLAAAGCFGKAAPPDRRHLRRLCKPAASLHPFDLCVGVAGAVAVRLIVYSKGKNAKKYRKGEEYGSARWGTAKDIAPYIDPSLKTTSC